MITLRLENSIRAAVQTMAETFHVREVDIYRFAVSYLLRRMRRLHEDQLTGSDLLPLMLEIREELMSSLSIKKHHLFNLLNGNNTHPDKFVAMSDVELLLSPPHKLREYLQNSDQVPTSSDDDTETQLKNYLFRKYRLGPFET